MTVCPTIMRHNEKRSVRWFTYNNANQRSPSYIYFATIFTYSHNDGRNNNNTSYLRNDIGWRKIPE